MPLTDLITGVKNILAHQRKYDVAEDYYEGEQDEIFASANMRHRLHALSAAYKINLCNTPVDVLAERLEIVSVSVADNDAANRALQEQIWTHSIQLDVKDWLRQAGEYGDGILFVWPSNDSIEEVDAESENDQTAVEDISSDDESQEAEPPPGPGVDIIWNSPKTARVIYDAENESYPIFAIKFWKEPGALRCSIYYPTTIERWIAGDDADPKDPKVWKQYVDDADENGVGIWPVENPYGKLPIFHLRNAKPYGRPEHKNAYGPQNAINKLIPAHMATIDFQSFPQRYALTETNPDGEQEDDATDWYPDDNLAQTVSQQDRSKLKAGAGELWWLDNVKEVGQFVPADSTVFTDPLPLYIKLMAQTTKTPLHYFDPSGGAPSGESLRAADMPMVKKAEDRQQRYGATLSDVLSFSLQIMGFPDCIVDISWASAGVADDQSSWETTQLKIDAGLPVRQALLESGYTTDQLDAWGITNDQSDIAQKRKVEILAQIATAGQAFGAAAGFGIFDVEAIKALLETVVNPPELPAST